MEDLTGQVDTVDTITAAEWNNLRQELKNLITDQGFTMSVGDLRQVQKAIAHQIYRSEFMVDSAGVADAYLLDNAASQQNPRVFVDGLTLSFRPVATNATATPTADITGIGTPKTIKREDGTALSAGDLSTSRDAKLRYDGTDWLLMNGSLASPVAALPEGFREGLTLSKDLSEVLANFQRSRIEPGRLRDATNAVNLAFATPFVKRFDATLAKGTGLGGYPPSIGARVINRWYRVFIVGRNTGGEVEAGYDSIANSAAQSLLGDLNTIDADSSWVFYRQIGWVKTTGTADQLVPFLNPIEDPNEFWFATGITADYNRGSAIASGINASETITIDGAPPSSVAILGVNGFSQQGSGSSGGLAIFTPILHPTPTPSQTVYQVGGTAIGGGGGASTPLTTDGASFFGTVKVKLDASHQCKVRWFGTRGSNFWPFANTLGFVYRS